MNISVKKKLLKCLTGCLLFSLIVSSSGINSRAIKSDLADVSEIAENASLKRKSKVCSKCKHRKCTCKDTCVKQNKKKDELVAEKDTNAKEACRIQADLAYYRSMVKRNESLIAANIPKIEALESDIALHRKEIKSLKNREREIKKNDLPTSVRDRVKLSAKSRKLYKKMQSCESGNASLFEDEYYKIGEAIREKKSQRGFLRKEMETVRREIDGKNVILARKESEVRSIKNDNHRMNKANASYKKTISSLEKKLSKVKADMVMTDGKLQLDPVDPDM